MELEPHTDTSSLLTSPASLSPSPPRDLYPSPPSSQRTPIKRCASNALESQSTSGDDGLPVAKKRRTMGPGDRGTEYLDLGSGDLSGNQNKLLNKLLNVLHKKRKIVVIAGAGISVSAGSTCLTTCHRAQPLTSRACSSGFQIVKRSL